MNFKPTVKVDGKFHTNSLVFATVEEAERSARDLMGRWMLVTDWSTVETEDPVNYNLSEEGQLTAIQEDKNG